jgi:hypothetical protein
MDRQKKAQAEKGEVEKYFVLGCTDDGGGEGCC